MKQMMFSAFFPKNHPKAGKCTFFPAKMIRGEKIHTLRQSGRFEVGDVFQPKYWEGTPYRSKTVQFFEPLTITAKERVHITVLSNGSVMIDLKSTWASCISEYADDDFVSIAKNDGLSYQDFVSWFFPKPKPGLRWNGFLYCWHPNPTSISYLA